MMRILAFVLALLAFAVSAQAQDTARGGFDQVMKTRTLRCSYDSLPPFITVDPASHQVSGMLRDITDAIGARLDLKVAWTENAGYGQIAEGFNTGRYDAFCGVLWQTPLRAGAMGFSAPLYKNKVSPCVRGDSSEYETTTAALNTPEKTLAGYDGDVSLQIARNLFPKAKIVAIGPNTSFGEALQDIAAKKIDAIATCDRIIVDAFNKEHPGALKNAAPGNPITTVQVVLALPLGDSKLKSMIDTAIYDMTADGSLQKIIKSYLGPYIDNTIILPKPY